MICPMMTANEVMKVLRWSRRRLQYAIKRRELPYVKDGRSLKFLPDDVAGYIASRRVIPSRAF